MKNELKKILPPAINLSSEMLDQMQQHWELLLAWNSRVNLTSITSPREAAARHYRDSLATMEHGLRGPIVDMGSGGGFPGIPLAIAMPETPVTLVEPRRKRVSFLRTAVSRLALNNVKVVMSRAEDGPKEPFMSLVTRATFSSPEELAGLLPWVLGDGMLYFHRSASCEPVAKSTRVLYDVDGDSRALDLLSAAQID
jgi:16S rRNA (guanine527-N7)-methyltransferase